MRLNKSLIAAAVATTLLPTAGAEEVDHFILEEIIVTATKREQALIDVPMSVSAFGERKLERIGADNFDGFVAQVPGLTLNSNGGNSAKFSIRGITTSAGQSNTQSPVAIYHDELPVLDSFAPLVTPDLRLFDVNRVEVLRGPQGTLFGSGALGGAIRVITNKPKVSEFEAKVATTISTIDGGKASYGYNAMVNIPLINDELALRAVVYSRDGGGYVDNVTRGDSNVDSQESLGGRLMVKWDATKDLSFLFSVVSQDDETNDRAFTNLDGPEDEYDSFTEEPANLDFTSENIVVEYDFGPAVITSSTTLSTRHEDVVVDASEAFSILSTVFGIPGASNRIQGTTDSFAQEVRLTSSGDGSLEWLIGAFYMNSERSYSQALTAPGYDNVLTALSLSAFIAGDPYPMDTLLGSQNDIELSEKALFGEVSYDLNDTLSATFGARWFSNRQSLQAEFAGSEAVGFPDTTRDSDEKAITPKFSISYRPNNDVHYYVSATKGYRVGQNNFTTPTADSPAFYDADSLWNYELGLKTALLNGNLDIEVAAFYIDWQDIQLQQRNSGGFNYTDNVGEATSKGVELSLNFNPSENLTLGTAITYIDTELTSVEAGVIAMKGDELPGTAKFKISNHIQWTQYLNADVVGHVRIDHSYSSSAFANLNNQTSEKTDVYNVLNLHAGADFGSWELDLFAKNLTGTHRIANVVSDLFGDRAIRVKPRELGVSFRYSF